MNCRDCERLLLADLGAASSDDAAAVAAHVQACAQCAALQARLAAAFGQWQTETAAQTPDAAAAWRELRPRLAARPRRTRRLAPLLWFSVPLAAAAALALLVHQPAATPAAAARTVAHADYVEAGNPAASTVVYVDNDSGWLVVWAADAKG